MWFKFNFRKRFTIGDRRYQVVRPTLADTWTLAGLGLTTFPIASGACTLSAAEWPAICWFVVLGLLGFPCAAEIRNATLRLWTSLVNLTGAASLLAKSKSCASSARACTGVSVSCVAPVDGLHFPTSLAANRSLHLQIDRAMGKERFTINPFPALELSDAEKNQLLDLGRTIIEANFERDEPFFKGGRKVDHRRWKLAKEREHMLVYTERPEYKGADAMRNTMHSSSKLPAILSVGRVEGKLDDMMYGVVNPTLEDMRIKASYVHDFDGAAVLSTIVEPTIDEPFNSVVVKWMEMDIPLRRTGVVQNRDYVYLECTGFVQKANGDRAGYHFLHSIDFPQIPKLSNRVRGDLSICGFFRQFSPNTLDVSKTGLMDPAGDMIRMLAVPVMTEAFLSPLRYVHCGQMRKLTWKMEKAHAEARQHGAPNPGSACVTCGKPSTGWTLGKSATTCKCCFRVLCSGCKIKKKISLVTADLTLSERKINFCTACLAESSTSSAVDIASYQIMENGRKSGIIRSATSHSSSSSEMTMMSQMSM